uniref:Uncharacterized protein n=1 Tax=viral metagenome TaxID=1070528 RepID=A0A6C0BVB0_9ZZZZ
MIVALTTASLDITLGITWWTIKQVFSGAIYLGTYFFSESSASKKNKILGDDINFVPHAFPIVELEVTHSHTTVNRPEPKIVKDDTNVEDFVEISILTTKYKYFKIPLVEIINRKQKLPLWFVPFLNNCPLTNYSITKLENCSFSIKEHAKPIISPFTLNNHLLMSQSIPHHFCVYLNHDDVETSLITMSNNLH